MEFEGVNKPFNYIQFVPSFSYNIIDGKISVPIEIGVGINKMIRIQDNFGLVINQLNYDYRVSTGINCSLNGFILGGNFVLSKAIRSYELRKYTTGSFNPYQYGAEVSVAYFKQASLLGESPEEKIAMWKYTISKTQLL